MTSVATSAATTTATTDETMTVRVRGGPDPAAELAGPDTGSANPEIPLSMLLAPLALAQAGTLYLRDRGVPDVARGAETWTTRTRDHTPTLDRYGLDRYGSGGANAIWPRAATREHGRTRKEPRGAHRSRYVRWRFARRVHQWSRSGVLQRRAGSRCVSTDQGAHRFGYRRRCHQRHLGGRHQRHTAGQRPVRR